MSDPIQKTPEAWTKNLLLGSFALNIFLAGFLFANVLNPTPDPAPKPAFSLSTLPVDISGPFGERLEDSFRPHQKDMERAYENLWDVRVRMREILAEEQFDEVALRDALANVRDLQMQIQLPMHEALIEAAKDLDFETRQNLNILNNTFEGPGTWEIRRIDGARWKVESDDGEIVIDFKGFLDRENDEDDEDNE